MNDLKLKVVLSTKISSYKKYYNFFFCQTVSIECPCKGIVKNKNEKEIFIAVVFYIFDIHIYFFRTVTRTYMPLSVRMELPI